MPPDSARGALALGLNTLDPDAGLALLLEGISELDVGLTVFDRDLVLVAANRRFQQMLNFPDALCQPGATMEQALRFNAGQGEYGLGDREQQVRERMALSRQFLPHHFERARPDGSIIEVRGTPLAGGGMVTTYTDVTEARRREQALRELSNELERRVAQRTEELQTQQQQFQHKANLLEVVVNHMNQGISYYNPDLLMQLCNPRYVALLGCPPELAVSGTSFETLLRYNAERGEYGPGEVEQQVRERLAAVTSPQMRRFERTRPNGIVLEVTSGRTPDGGVVATYSDITERKAAENRVRELNETLEKRVEERTAQLAVAMQTLHHSQEELALSQAKATLGTLVASVSHELGTPLGNSLMMATTLSDHARRYQALVDGGQLKRSDLTNLLTVISEGSALMQRNLHRAVELMRNFKQVAADQASEQRRSFDLGAVVGEVVDTLRPSLKRQSHQLLVQIPDGISMDSYPGPLGQVVINLVNNAYLHAFEGRDDGVLTISATADQAGVCLHVADNGAGMPPELLAHLFQPFFSTKIGRGGTGLGMTIVENLVKKVLGGTLAVQSTVGQGSTFTLRLPLVAPLPAPAEDEPNDG